MSFKKDFVWGSATASYQIEGAAFEDGRGPSIWDVFSHAPGKVFRGHTGDVACDHYHHMEEDVAMMAGMGLKNYRFSVSWSRLIPEGIGAVNEKGIAFYDRLIDRLLENGIRPWMTVYHWDYPQALAMRGAWENPDSPKWFADYTQLIADRYGDRVKDFITLNEPQCFIGLGYRMKQHAPGLDVVDADIVPMAHNVLLSHGAASDVLRQSVPGCKIGYAPCANVSIPYTEAPEDIEAARRSYFSVPNQPGWPFCVTWWSDPVMLGTYPEDGLKRFEQFLPRGWEKDMERIHRVPDYYCQNIYNGTIVRAAKNHRGFEQVLPERGSPKTAVNWDVSPDALYWGPKFLYERYKTPFIISENGMSAHDLISADGKVHDPNRIEYMRRYLKAYRRAAEDGVDAAGYFAWSLMDNYEWENGYGERFGLVYVDYADNCRRVPKDSAEWYKGIIESNGDTL